jgi:hypothetical protein
MGSTPWQKPLEVFCQSVADYKALPRPGDGVAKTDGFATA